MRGRGAALSGLVLAAALASCATAGKPAAAAPVPEPGMPFKSASAISASVPELEATIAEFINSREVIAIQASLFAEGKLVAELSGGHRDLAKKHAASSGDMFQGASLTKPLTAYAVLVLVDRGLLGLDEPADSYLAAPFLRDAEASARVTVRMLLSHSSGLPNDPSGKDQALRFAPGSAFLYSGAGYLWLQRVIEGASGIPYGAFVKSAVLDPLGMKDTRLKEKGEGLGPRLQETRMRLGPIAIKPPYVIDRENAAFSIITTSSDYARLMMEIARPSLVPAGLVAEMRRPQIKVNDSVSWGLGVGIQRGAEGEAIWHDGFNAMGAWSSFALLDPATCSGIVVFAAGPEAPVVLRDIAFKGIGGFRSGYWDGIPK
jgi:CubicO group peptidase (beta-lactamase class C family)